MKESFKNKVWQSIITQKIRNQALCLQKNNIDNDKLLYYSNIVKPADKTNVEAFSSAFYFKKLFYKFDSNFVRQDYKVKKDKLLINMALNYTYAIVRAIIIKYIIAVGFIPYFGIFHKSKTNPFNLADDLIEPIRPIVDYHIYNMTLNIFF